MTQEEKALLNDYLVEVAPYQPLVNVLVGYGYMWDVDILLYRNSKETWHKCCAAEGTFTTKVMCKNSHRVVDIDEIKPFLRPMPKDVELTKEEILENYYDYLGLIEKGLAKDGTDLYKRMRYSHVAC